MLLDNKIGCVNVLSLKNKSLLVEIHRHGTDDGDDDSRGGGGGGDDDVSIGDCCNHNNLAFNICKCVFDIIRLGLIAFRGNVNVGRKGIICDRVYPVVVISLIDDDSSSSSSSLSSIELNNAKLFIN